MKEGEGIKKWLAIVIIIIIIAIIVCLVVFLPILIEQAKSTESEFIIDLQIGNSIAVLYIPSRITEFKQDAEVVKVSLLEAPFISARGEVMIAVRNLGILFPAEIQWCSQNKNITVTIPAAIISRNKLVFNLTSKDYLIKNNRAFVSLKTLSKTLKISEIIWSSETNGLRLTWYNN